MSSKTPTSAKVDLKNALEEALYGIDARDRDEGRAIIISRGSLTEIEELVNTLSAPLSTTRRRAVRLLGELQPHRALPPLRAWVDVISRDHWSQLQEDSKPLREGLVGATRLLNQLTPRGEREATLDLLWSAPLLKVKKNALCPASSNELLVTALQEQEHVELRELAAAEALRRLQRLDADSASERKLLITQLLDCSLDQLMMEFSSANEADSGVCSALEQLVSYLYPNDVHWSTLALQLDLRGIRCCRDREILIQVLTFATRSLSKHQKITEATEAILIEVLTSLERITLLEATSTVSPATQSIDSDTQSGSQVTVFDGVDYRILEILSQLSSSPVRSLTARFLPVAHPLLENLVQDTTLEVAWCAQASLQGRSSVSTLCARLGAHERLKLPSARPPYGLRAFDELPSIQRVSGALALCQARFDVNLGVAMRSAEAAGLSEIFVVGARSGSLSSARGAEYALPITWFTDPEELMIEARRRGYQLVAVQQTPDSEPYHLAHYPPRPLFVLGSEDAGLPDSLRLAADLVVEIPLYGAIDSLNVATAATCVMMHWRAHLSI